MELKVVAGKAAGTSIEVLDRLEVGRAADPPGNLGEDPSLSRRHARFSLSGNKVVVEDLGSSYGTAVNGSKISSPTVLSPGDRIQLGDTTLELVGAAAPAAAAVPPPRVDAPAAGAGTPARGTPPASSNRGPLVPILIVLVVILAVGNIVGFLVLGDDDDDGASTAAGDPAGWLYAVSNLGPGEANSVLAIDYYDDGTLSPANIREFPTRGAGGTLMPGSSLGTLAGDTQVTISEDGRFLFAVNQGSDTIAVFEVDSSDGSLEHVEGSPFPSGGKAPVSTSFNGEYLVVVNKGILPGEELPGDPDQTNYTTFSVSDDGALEQVDSLPTPGTGPTAGAFAPNGRVVFGADFYSFELNSFTVDDAGMITPAPGSPQQFPDSVIAGREPPPDGDPESLLLPYGIVAHPTLPFVYYIAAGADRVTVYRYNEDDGSLEFVSQVDNPDTFASCWAVITDDGRFLYTGNSSLNITAYGVSEDGETLERVELEDSQTRSTIANLALSEDEGFLFALGTSDSPDFPLGNRAAPANSVESFAVGEDGMLEPIGSVALPVPTTTLPVGLAALERSE